MRKILYLIAPKLWAGVLYGELFGPVRYACMAFIVTGLTIIVLPANRKAIKD